jgi:mono/diheme cytochrome c family protein
MRGAVRRPAVSALVLTAAACGSARRGEAVSGPLVLAGAADRGAVVFMERCHKCHPLGEAGLGPALNDKPLPDWLKRVQVRQGLGVMPSFPHSLIPDEQLDDLLAYLSALRAHPAPEGG